MRLHNVPVMWILISAVILLCVWGLGIAQSLTYPVFTLEHTPQLDGKVDGDPAWQNIPEASGLRLLGSGRPAAKDTTVRVGWDSEALYVAMWCAESDMDNLQAESTSGDPAIWKNDGVEIFVQPAEVQWVYQVIVNAAGAHTNYITRSITELDPGYCSPGRLAGSQTAAFQGPAFWSAEIRLPFETLSRVPQDDEVWSANFCRDTTAGGLKHASWAATRQRYCEPQRFGKLTFHSRQATAEDAKILSATPRVSEQQEHLILHLTLDEGSGEVAHGWWPTTNDGTIHDAAWVPGKFGSALKFDGRTSYVKVPNSASLESIEDALTVEAWCYFDLDKLAGRDATIIAKTPRSGFGTGFYLSYADTGNRVQAIVFGVAQEWGVRLWGTANNAITSPGWHHIMATYDANDQEGAIYVDGRQVEPFTGVVSKINPGGVPVTVGIAWADWEEYRAGKPPTASPFVGIIDEAKIWNRVFSASELKDLYGAGWIHSNPLTPKANERVTEASPIFTWTEAGEESGYVFEISMSPTFPAGASQRVELKECRYRPEQPLSAGVWYWRVWSTDPDGTPTTATSARALIVSWEEDFQHADTTPPVLTDIRPVRDTRADTNRPVISAKWSDDSQLELASAQLLLDGEDLTAEAEITAEGITYTPPEALRNGVHTVEVAIEDAAGNRANQTQYHFSVGEPYHTVVEIGADKRCYINGEPFFPITLYHGSCMGGDFEEIARIGFNSIYGGMGIPDPTATDHFGLGFSRFEQTGLKYIGGIPRQWHQDAIQTEAFKEALPYYAQPAFLCYTMDEPNGAPGGLQWAKAFYKVLEENEAKRPALWILNSPGAATSFGPPSDGLMIDCYPVPTKPILQVARSIDQMQRGLAEDKPVWFIAQALAWKLQRPPYYPIPEGKTKEEILRSLQDVGYVFRPTAEELRCMTYLALAHDIQGFMFYPGTGGARHIGIGDFPKPLAAMKKLAGEIRYLAPMLLAPDDPEDVRTLPEGLDLHLMARRYADRLYIIAVNPTDLPIAPTFALRPSYRNAQVKVLFENRSLSLEGGRFRDFFAPLGSHVYCVKQGE